MIAAIRPDSVNLPLLLHVLGAMLLVGALFAVALATYLGRSPDRAPGLARFGLKTLLIGVLPSYVLMRIGAQWTEAEQDYPDDFDPAWVGIGYITADIGALLILISTVLAAIGLRRSRGDANGGVRFARIVGVISVLLLAAYLVAVWAMTAKPT
ncbi:MAG: hypothetical protein ACXWZB_06690 [Gaiellaceae bacterium]